MPDPDRPAVSAGPTLGVMVNVPVRVPNAVGANVTFTVHVPLAGIALPHVFVCTKSPLIATVTGSALACRFVTVTVFTALAVFNAWFPKPTDTVDKYAGTIPAPVRLTIWVLPLVELSVTVTFPLTIPLTAGVKVIVMVHFPPTATLAPQVFVWVNGGPLATMLLMLRAAVPVLLSVTFAEVLLPRRICPMYPDVTDNVAVWACAAPRESISRTAVNATVVKNRDERCFIDPRIPWLSSRAGVLRCTCRRPIWPRFKTAFGGSIESLGGECGVRGRITNIGKFGPVDYHREH